MIVMVLVAVPMVMTMPVLLLLLFRPVFFARHVLLAIDPDVNLRGRNTATNNSRNFQTSAYGLLQQARRNSGIDKGAEEHVAAYTGKTFKIGYPHKIQVLTTGDTENAHSRSVSVTSVVKGLTQSRRETFMIGKQSTSVKRAPLAHSDKITVS